MNNCKKCGKELLVFDSRVKYCERCRETENGERVSVKACLMCGEDVVNVGMQRRELHPQCVYDDIYETIAEKRRITAIQYSRAFNYGVNIKEVKQIVKEDKEGRLI